MREDFPDVASKVGVSRAGVPVRMEAERGFAKRRSNGGR